MALNLPKKPKQSIWDKVKDTFDANTEADVYRRAVQDQQRASAGLPTSNIAAPDRRNLFTKLRDQVNPLDNGVSFTNPLPTSRRSVISQTGRNLKAATLGLGRSTFGTAEGLSGLYDLVTPGTGQNRLTQLMRNTVNPTLDRIVEREGLSGGIYKGGQLAGEIAQMALTAGAATAASKSKYAAPIASRIPQVTKGGAVGKWLASPATVANVAQDTAVGSGQRSAKGEDVSAGTIAQDALTSLAFQGAVKGATKVPGLVKRGVEATPGAVRKLESLVQDNPQAPIKPVVTSKKPTTTQVSSIAQGRAVEAPVVPTGKEAFIPGEAKPVVNLKQTEALPTRMKGGTGPEYQRDMNVKNYDLPEEDLKVLSDLSGKSVKRMKNTDIVEAANFVGVDTTRLNDRETLAVLAGRLNQSKETTSKVAQIGELKKAGATEDEIRQAIADARKSIEIDQNQKTFAGRQLQMERIIKSKLSPEDKFIRMLVTSGADPDKIDNTLLNLDLSTPEAAVRAWREAVPATLENWLDKYRYTNMLSSPLTHVVNIVGNLQSTAGVRPLTMAVTGALDAAKSVVTGKPRAQFAGEAPRYLKGAVQNVSKAVDEAVKSISRFGEYAKNPDMIGDFDTPLAVGGLKGQADAAISFIPKLLNAGDIFFRTIAEGGETAGLNYRASKGAFTGDIAEQATKNADYTLFRGKLGEKEQGYLLKSLDFLPQSINRARNSDSVIVRNIAKATFPFVSTPTNIFKQGIEYSPAGFLTIAGNRDKTAQAAKALMGTTAVAMAAGTFAANDAITGAEPSDKAQRDAFRAEGKQPWSVKIGGKWVQYSKLHPSIAFNLATVAAVKDAIDNGTIDQDGADKVMSMVGGVLGFYRDQSYFKGIGDFTNMIQGIDTSSIGDTASSVVGSTASQYLPLQSFNNWVGRLINDTQTKVDYSADFVQQTLQRLFKDYPAGGEMTGAPERENPYTGGPIEVENRGINAFSPLKVTNDKGFGNTTGLNVDERQMMQDAPDKEQFRQDVMQQKGAERLDKKLKTEMADTDAEIRQGATGKFYAKLDGKVTSFDTKEKADIAVAKDKFSKSDKNFEIVGETVFRKSATGEVTAVPKIKYDTDLTWAELTKHKKADNLDAWMTSAEKQLQNLEKQLQDPNIDELDRIKIENSAQGLIEDMVKYSEYAGFTKGGSGGGRRGSGGGGAGSGGGSINAAQFLSGAPQAKASVRPTVSARSTAKYRVAKRSTAKPTVTVRKSKV